MSAGRLDRPVQFYRLELSAGDFGQVEAWAAHGGPVWAARKDISDGERWRAGEVQAHVTTRFTIRWSDFAAGITPRDRLESEGATFEIVGIKEGAGRRQWLELTCARRNDQ